MEDKVKQEPEKIQEKEEKVEKKEKVKQIEKVEDKVEKEGEKVKEEKKEIIPQNDQKQTDKSEKTEEKESKPFKEVIKGKAPSKKIDSVNFVPSGKEGMGGMWNKFKESFSSTVQEVEAKIFPQSNENIETRTEKKEVEEKKEEGKGYFSFWGAISNKFSEIKDKSSDIIKNVTEKSSEIIQPYSSYLSQKSENLFNEYVKTTFDEYFLEDDLKSIVTNKIDFTRKNTFVKFFEEMKGQERLDFILELSRECEKVGKESKIEEGVVKLIEDYVKIEEFEKKLTDDELKGILLTEFGGSIRKITRNGINQVVNIQNNYKMYSNECEKVENLIKEGIVLINKINSIGFYLMSLISAIGISHYCWYYNEMLNEKRECFIPSFFGKEYTGKEELSEILRVHLLYLKFVCYEMNSIKTAYSDSCQKMNSIMKVFIKEDKTMEEVKKDIDEKTINSCTSFIKAEELGIEKIKITLKNSKFVFLYLKINSD